MDIALDAAGNTYAIGGTMSTNFPVPMRSRRRRARCRRNPGPSVATRCVHHQAVTNGVGIFSTYFGGIGHEYAQAAAVGPAGNLVFAGTGDSDDYPTVNPLFDCPARGFITRLNAAGNAILYSTCFPGDINGLALDSAGAIYVAGYQRRRKARSRRHKVRIKRRSAACLPRSSRRSAMRSSTRLHRSRL